MILTFGSVALSVLMSMEIFHVLAHANVLLDAVGPTPSMKFLYDRRIYFLLDALTVIASWIAVQPSWLIVKLALLLQQLEHYAYIVAWTYPGAWHVKTILEWSSTPGALRKRRRDNAFQFLGTFYDTAIHALMALLLFRALLASPTVGEADPARTKSASHPQPHGAVSTEDEVAMSGLVLASLAVALAAVGFAVYIGSVAYDTIQASSAVVFAVKKSNSSRPESPVAVDAILQNPPPLEETFELEDFGKVRRQSAVTNSRILGLETWLAKRRSD